MKPPAHIAIVDDDEAIRIGLSSLLRASGYEVELYDSGEALIGSLAGMVPSCVVTDIQMPGLNGLDLQSKLNQEFPGVKVIMMTAFPHPTVRERALAAGAICYLSKPFAEEDLLACLRAALEQ